jgi:methylated-DNA-protein-cysteine methyltransferase related protein
MKKDDNFFHKVYEVVQCVPQGKVTTYGAIARFLGSPQSSRMVGWALNSAKYDIGHIPAHRVVNRRGELSGKMHFRTPDMMQQLLESEGIPIWDDRVQDFEKYFWDPYNYLD